MIWRDGPEQTLRRQDEIFTGVGHGGTVRRSGALSGVSGRAGLPQFRIDRDRSERRRTPDRFTERLSRKIRTAACAFGTWLIACAQCRAEVGRWRRDRFPRRRLLVPGGVAEQGGGRIERGSGYRRHYRALYRWRRPQRRPLA